MENMNTKKKDINLNHLESFLIKVQDKLKEGIEDIGNKNESILNKWIDDIKSNPDKTITININEHLLETSKQDIIRNIDHLFKLSDKIRLDNISEESISEADTIIKKICLSEEEIDQLEIYLVNLISSKDPYDILISFSYGSIALKYKSLEMLIQTFKSNFETLIKFKEYRIRMMIPEITNLIIINKPELKSYFIEICFNDVVRNILDNDSQSSLDTSNRTLQYLLNTADDHIISIINIHFETFINNMINDNKGIRIICYELISKFISVLNFDLIKIKNDILMEHIYHGLTDIWPQVIFSCLNMLSCLYDISLKNNYKLIENKYFIEKILPKVCLSRYIPVEGIKTVSLKLWKDIVDINGITIIKHNYNHFLLTYLNELDGKTNTLREASCRCLQELVIKVYDDTFKDIMNENYKICKDRLFKCYIDRCWNVREASFNASGYIFENMKENINESEYMDIVNFFFLHLNDNIYEVRDAAAFAIKNIRNIVSYNIIDDKILSCIENLRDSKLLNQDYERCKTRIFEYIQKEVDFGFMREPDYWEYIDGIIHLIKENFEFIKNEKTIMTIIDFMCLNYNKEFMTNMLKKTIWECMNLMFSSINKNEIDDYFDMISNVLIIEIENNSNSLCGFEAEKFICEIAKIKNIRFLNKRLSGKKEILEKINKLINCGL